MQHECRITDLETKCFPDLQEKYLADPKSGPCPFFKPGDTFLLKRTPQQDDFYHLMNGRFCGEAWDAIRVSVSPWDSRNDLMSARFAARICCCV